ncbi:MAG: PD-(D/E)XK nuclease family protein, partial [Oscillospiraceae bacterium]|nr:PD-(D/E)XK nuclease family protein [Oscillospiraceae bacterium]
AEAAEEAESLPPSWKAGSLRRPAFIGEKQGLTPAERGTALHLVMQHIDYGSCGSAEGIEAEKKRLLEKRLITPQQAEAAPAEKILAFFESPLGRRVLSADRVTREFKFSLLVPASEYYPDGKGRILLQGVVDCFIEEAGELSVIDFKTDRVGADRLEERAGAYRPQLDAYAAALERITGKKVKQKLLYYFSAGKYTEI